MDRTILILGAGVMQLPAVRAARRLGLHVIVADANTGAPAIDEADEFLHVDLKDHEAMARAASEVESRRGLDAVFTAGTDFSATVAWVAEKLGLPGTRYEAALDATDKFRMRRVLEQAGVSVPEFAVLTREQIEQSGCSSVKGQVTLPVVVKPVDSMGARGVVRADSWEEADAFASEAVEYSRGGRVVIEGYIDGPEFSLDAIVYDDDIQITGFADRHIFFPPYFIEMGHTIPTSADPEIQQLVIDEFKRAIRALGIGPGAAKGDVKYSTGGAVIGEVAARLSGGYMSGWTFPLATGVPLTEIGIRVALGDVPPRARHAWSRTSAERAIISIPGRLAAIRGVESARASHNVAEVFLTRSDGETV
ncbi:MAG TPA: ATP-grasp domain-containing protein, partial [Spirochaetia bacterium]|nr:ATP-grasp domain-containing protein [Spirochaetia bacterium]